jgi:hypothetical protein
MGFPVELSFFAPCPPEPPLSHTCVTVLRQSLTLNCGWSCMGPVWKRREPWLVLPRGLPPNSVAPWAVPRGRESGHRWTVLGPPGTVPSCYLPQLWGKSLSYLLPSCSSPLVTTSR